jgi:hypothetical protein
LGLRHLRTGALLQFLGVILAIIGILAMFTGGMVGMMTMNPMAVLAGAIGFVAILLTGVVVGLIGYIFWFMATGSFKQYSPERLGIGRTGMKLVVLGAILVILGLAMARVPSC